MPAGVCYCLKVETITKHVIKYDIIKKEMDCSIFIFHVHTNLHIVLPFHVP